MRIMALALVWSAAVLEGRGLGAAAGQEVDVYVHNHVSIGQPVMYRATVEASGIFRGIGVRLEWKTATPPRGPGCRQFVILTIAESAPRDSNPLALALTELHSGAVTVFYDQLRPLLFTWPSLLPTLMAHVLAHEIAHSLQGLRRHSEAGIMKPYWTVADYHAMQDGRLAFTPLDATLIRAGIAAGASGCQVLTAP